MAVHALKYGIHDIKYVAWEIHRGDTEESVSSVNVGNLESEFYYTLVTTISFVVVQDASI
jgi:hypothetical protein